MRKPDPAVLLDPIDTMRLEYRGADLDESQVTPVFERHFYRPVITAVERLADLIGPVRSGDVNLYLLCVFLALLACYLLDAV